MENIFNAKDDKHREDGVSEDNQQSVPEVPEGHSFEKHGGDFVNGGKNEGIKEYPAEVLDTRNGAVDVFEFDIVAAIVNKLVG